MEPLKLMVDRVRGLFRKNAIERDMDNEMRFHLEMLVQEYERSGMRAGEARAAALRRFGNMTQLKERGHDVRGGGILDELRQDLQYGLRMLRRNPGFTVVALIALSLGVGVNTAIFSIANGLFFRSTQDGNGALVRMYGEREGGGGIDVMSWANYKDVSDQSRSFSAIAAHQYVPVGISIGSEDSAETQTEIVSANYFSVFEVKPRVGQFFTPNDDNATSPHLVTAVSERFIKTRLASDKNPIGRRIYVNGSPVEIVAVVPESFQGTFAAFTTDMWFPFAAMEIVRPRGIPLTNRGWGWLFATGRLKPGVSLAQAKPDVDRIVQQLAKDFPRPNDGLRFQLLEAGALPDEFRANASRFLLFFMVAAGAVLLITCANIASMMLARAAARGREVAIRQSLGAGRWRLRRQWVTESVLLSAMGGGAGFVIAIWLRQALLGFAPPEWSNFAPDLAADWRVVTFAIGLVLLTGVLFGLAPALAASRASLVLALKSDGSSTMDGGRSRFYGFVVAVQVTLSLVLMIVSGLLFRSLQQAESFRPGFDSDKLVIAQFDLRRNGYQPEARREFFNRLVANLRNAPNVAGVTSALVVPLSSDREAGGYQIEGVEPPKGKSAISIGNDSVGPHYFSTMGIPIVEGRDFDSSLPAGPPSEAIVNEAMAQRYWPNESAIGKVVTDDGIRLRIVGVARTIPYYVLGETAQPYIYVPSGGNVPSSLTVLVKSATDASSIVAGVRQAVRATDPKVSSNRILTFAELRRGPLFPMRALLAVAGSFGLLAMILTLIGVYAVISYSVTRRTREFGIRIALGARRATVFQMVVGEGLKLAAIGILLGLAGALVCTRFLSTLLFGVSATDPVTFIVISLLMAVTAAMACYIPARRATKVDPIIALRQDG